MDNGNFSEWLRKIIQDKGWTEAELARRSGIRRQNINNYINSKITKPDEDVLKAIARALRLPPETVFRAAGLLPPSKPLDAKREMIVFLAEQLPEEEYEDLLAYINLRIERSKERGRRGEAEGAKIPAGRAG